MSLRIHKRPVRFALVATVLLLLAIAALQMRIDAQTRSIARQKEEVLYLSGPQLKKLSLGYDSLLADIYWTRAVQYYGNKLHNQDSQFELLFSLLDVATTLDPNFIIAYHFGAIFLSEPPPIGAGRTELAIELVKKGIAADSNDWQLNFDLGFLYYWHLMDFEKASAAFERANNSPGAPAWLKQMIVRVGDQSEALDTSRAIWSRIYEASQNQQVKAQALRHLIALRALKDEGFLNEEAQEYRQRFGRYPTSTEELHKAGIIRGVPLDPAGFPYIFGPDGKSRPDPRSPVTIESVPGGPPK
jgi:tetratricopeptide (TPR) repeat protein